MHSINPLAETSNEAFIVRAQYFCKRRNGNTLTAEDTKNKTCYLKENRIALNLS